MWDNITCWPSAGVGEVVTITCPVYFSYFSDQHKGKHCVEPLTTFGPNQDRISLLYFNALSSLIG